MKRKLLGVLLAFAILGGIGITQTQFKVNPTTGQLDYYTVLAQEIGEDSDVTFGTLTTATTITAGTTITGPLITAGTRVIAGTTVTGADGFIHGATTTATATAAFTVNWTLGQIQQITITGTNLDITMTNPAGPCRLCLIVIQGDGNDTIDWTNEADLLWPGGTDPVLSTGAADIDIITIIWDGTHYFGVANYDFN